MDNDFIIHEDYVEIILRNKSGERTGVTLIDLDDFELISKHTWSIDTHGYARASKNSKNIWMHKLITKTSSQLVDHIDRNRLNNRRGNLRIADRNINATNKGIQSNNSSGVAGVSFYKRDNKWVAEIKYNGKKSVIGRFLDKEEAIMARLRMECNLLGELAPQRYLFEKYRIEVES